MSYHIKHIEKGKLGEVSKILEEFEEFFDAVEQRNKLLQLCELADLIGAIELYVAKFNISLEDLIHMKNLTQSAFKDGSRKQK